MLVAGPAESLEEGLGRSEDAPFSLEGLDEDGAGLPLGEDGLCCCKVEVRDGVDLIEREREGKKGRGRRRKKGKK